MYCCAKCFGDPFLERVVIPKFTVRTGVCDYCGCSAGELVEPTVLADQFFPLLIVYEPNVDGEELHELLNRDWKILPPARISRASAATLLGEILGSATATQRYKPRLAGGVGPLEQWQAFRLELMERNRYFPESIPELSNLGDLLWYLQPTDSGYPTLMFRARTYGSVPHLGKDMGAPPAALCSQGRANPVGIPFLYLASDPQTAASEVRPHTGDGVCVAKFALPDGLKLVDLRAPMQAFSPFAIQDETIFERLYRARPLLLELGEELTRPIGPRTAPIEYLPTQYLCEFFKKSGFDGVIYRSSVGPGINVALFDVDKATVGAVSHHRVMQVSVTMTQVGSA